MALSLSLSFARAPLVRGGFLVLAFLFLTWHRREILLHLSFFSRQQQASKKEFLDILDQKKGKTRKTKISLFSLKSKTCIDFGHKKNKRCRRFNDFPHTNPPRAPYITTATLTRLLYAPSLTLSRARHASSKDVVFIVVFIVVVVGYVVVSPASKARQHST